MADGTALRHPAVSVVISTFERPRYTCEAIHSVLGQTFEDFEIVVVDDGSGDDTVARVKGFGDPRLAVVEIPHSGRPATVRNAGIERESGEYVAFPDSDDLWLPTKLERQLEVLAASGHGWARTGGGGERRTPPHPRRVSPADARLDPS